MYISCNWIRDYVDLPADMDPRRLADRLTITTAEVESVVHETAMPDGVIVSGSDTIDRSLVEDWLIEIDNKSITHRPDLWGHYGMAREIAAIVGRPLKPLPLTDEAILRSSKLAEIPIDIRDPEKCARYCGLKLRIDGNSSAPLWMQLRLARVGIRPLSLVVDLTNYVMADIGQPMHAFDAAKVDRIEVGVVSSGTKFRALDAVERTLPDNALMILCGNKPIAIAGIIGGESTEIGTGTSEVLLESANFDAAAIRRTAVAIGHRTDASTRFEKSLDPNNAPMAIQRFISLAERCGVATTVTSRLSDSYPRPLTVSPIRVSLSHIDRTIGAPVGANRVTSILEPLGFTLQRDGDDKVEVTPPTFRATKDISIEADIIEEIARSIGYDHIEPVLPNVVARPIDYSPIRVVERRSLELLTHGDSFIEVHGYIWYDDNWLLRIGYEPGACVRLKNPVTPHNARLRRQLVPNLLLMAEQNRFRMTDFNLVEVGTTFQAGTDEVTAAQERHLALAMARSGKKADAAAWSDVKNSVETWAAQVARQNITYRTAEPVGPWEDGSYLAEVMLDGRAIGRVSLVPLSLRLKIDERLRTLSIATAELNLNGLDPDALTARKLSPPPQHPEVALDFSFICDATRGYESLTRDIAAFSHPSLRRIHFVDSFEGGSIPQGKRSFTIRGVLGLSDRTLGEEDLASFKTQFSAWLTDRGMTLRG